MSCMCVCPCAGEDQYGVLAQYYSIPWLSYRDAVWHEYFADTPGFKRYEIFPVGEERHPTPLGHRCGPRRCLTPSAAVHSCFRDWLCSSFAHTAHHTTPALAAQPQQSTAGLSQWSEVCFV